MQAISPTKHQHLVDALFQLEDLLNGDLEQDRDKHLASAFREELQELYCGYTKQVAELSELIDNYHELCQKVKTQFLSPKLKALKKKTGHDVRVFPLLAQNIRLVYGA